MLYRLNVRFLTFNGEKPFEHIYTYNHISILENKYSPTLIQIRFNYCNTLKTVQNIYIVHIVFCTDAIMFV